MQYIHYQPIRTKVFSLFRTLGIDVHVALYQLFSSGWFQLLGSRVWCEVIVFVRTKFTDTRNRMSLTIISHPTRERLPAVHQHQHSRNDFTLIIFTSALRYLPHRV